MGRSAKVHKRVPKKNKTTSPTTSSVQPAQTQQLQAAKKKATLKEKSAAKLASSTRKEGEYVLGDVDYVSLMMGGRRKAKQEAEKLASQSQGE
ncbi:hypothetical protein D9758_002599 [Tetrapyrgos nigripes]|uniref:Uncharacterized protein n=1 Tax=Tetrapyrgos nigripes TaxID=182062 RepID=A0A8H5GR74_9AGAR|nr:hypothetical protein D9758_002599 [Tetrapyrgos nigripes]